MSKCSNPSERWQPNTELERASYWIPPTDPDDHREEAVDTLLSSGTSRVIHHLTGDMTLRMELDSIGDLDETEPAD